MPSANWPTTAIHPFGRLNKALEEAPAKGWAVLDMKNDWKTVFPQIRLFATIEDGCAAHRRRHDSIHDRKTSIPAGRNAQIALKNSA
jgi:hypothetical protein